MVRIVRHKDINKKKWDHCLQNSRQERVYAYYDFLTQNIGNRWFGLVFGDYDAIMPITLQRKYGFLTHIAQPNFCQQLGVFSKVELDQDLFQSFMKMLDKKLIFKTHYFFNASNTPFLNQHKKRPNFILNLHQNYHNIYDGYKEDLKRNIKKAEKNRLIWEENISVGACTNMYEKTHGRHYANLDYAFFNRIKKNTQIKMHQIGVKKENELLAVSIILQDNGRLYYLLGAPSVKGRKLGALPFLIDRLIKKFSEKKIFLDFEGSQIPSVANFYQKFGTQTEYFIEYQTRIFL